MKTSFAAFNKLSNTYAIYSMNSCSSETGIHLPHYIFLSQHESNNAEAQLKHAEKAIILAKISTYYRKKLANKSHIYNAIIN